MNEELETVDRLIDLIKSNRKRIINTREVLILPRSAPEFLFWTFESYAHSLQIYEAVHVRLTERLHKELAQLILTIK
jgi:hypothetical protein